MRQISIAQRLRPFSHQPGATCLLPGSSLVVRAYPVRLELLSLDGSLLAERDWSLEGPVKQFTLQQDLEAGSVWVWGESKSGFYRFELRATLDGGALLNAGKGPMRSEQLLGNRDESYVPPSLERLSFGDHHKQEWELVTRRSSLEEMLPFWFALGQQTPSEAESLHNPNWQALLQGGFSGILVPHLVDPYHRGIALPPLEEPLNLLIGGQIALRSQLIRESDELELLPSLPAETPSGRMVNIQTKWGKLAMEWRSRRLRRVQLLPSVSDTISLKLPSEIKLLRFQGAKSFINEAFPLIKGEWVQWDHFER